MIKDENLWYTFITDNLATLIIPAIFATISWYFTKRAYQPKELKAKDLQNEGSQSDVIAQNLDLYQRMFEHLEEQLLKAHGKIKILEEEVDRISTEYNILKKDYENSINK